MAVTSGFFNSVNHDRLYDAEQVSSLFDGLILDGVYQAIGSAFMVRPNTEANDSVIVGTGRAWFDHTWTLNDAEFVLSIDPPNTLYSRKDFIVIDVDKSDSVRANSIKVVRGTMGQDPKDPTLINTDDHHQYPIARITVPAGESSIIQQDNIQYLVGTEPCPVVTGIVEALNLTNYLAQYDAQFNTWFEGIKDIFDEDPMTAFQNQIDNLNKKIDSIVPYTTRSVFDKMISGDGILNVSTFDVNCGINYYWYSPNRILGAILPDGKVAEVLFNIDHTSGEKVTLMIRLYSNTGSVLNEKTQQILNIANIPEETRQAPFHVTNVSVDTYPATITVGYFSNRKVVSAVATITNEGTVTFATSSQTVGSTGTRNYPTDSATMRPAHLPDGRSFGILADIEYKASQYYTSIYGASVSPEGTVYVNPTPLISAKEGSSGGNLLWSKYNSQQVVCYYVEEKELVYVEPFNQNGDFTDNHDENMEFLNSITINQIQYSTSSYPSSNKSLGSPHLAVDPYTLGIVSTNPGTLSTQYDTFFDMSTSILSDGSIKTYKYDHSTTYVQQSEEEFKCININSSPNLIEVPNIQLDKINGSEHSMAGLSGIRGQISNKGTNLLTGAIASNYSTGLSETKTISLTDQGSDGIQNIYPCSFFIRVIENVLYVMLTAKLYHLERISFAQTNTMGESGVARIVKVSFQE